MPLPELKEGTMTYTEIVKKLEKPKGKIDAVLDTDTFNEIDDQYALSYMLRSDEKIATKAIYAAPFSNLKAETPKEGMEKSYEEILRVLDLNGMNDLTPCVFRGSAEYLPDEKTPVRSDAAEDLVSRAMKYPEDAPLYVIAIGAITNIASAILMKPEIIDHIVVVWLGGNSIHWPDNKEFNLYQDIAAARIIFGCGVPLIQLPCMGVVSAFTTSGPELEYHLRGKNRLCDYLVDVTTEEALKMNTGNKETWSRPIWDATAIGWLLDGDYMDDCIISSPIPEFDHHYGFDLTRHPIKCVYHVHRDNLFADLFAKLAK